MNERHPSAQIAAEFGELTKVYPGLSQLITDGSARPTLIRGMCSFRATYGEISRQGEFAVEIVIPDDYPLNPPAARAMHHSVPATFHTNPDGTFCLGIPVEGRRVFAKRPTLLGFVEDLLIPFLFTYSAWRDSGILPYGEMMHGDIGVFQYYADLLETSTPSRVMDCLQSMVEGRYKGHWICHCGSGKRMRNCHGPRILEVQGAQPPGEFLRDLASVIQFLRESGALPPDWVASPSVRRLSGKLGRLRARSGARVELP